MTHKERERRVAEAYYEYVMTQWGMYSNPDDEIWQGFLKSDEYKAISEADEWIPVSERLPEKHDIVLAYHRKGDMLCEAIHGGIWTSAVNRFDSTNLVTHWRELPQPPKQ